MKYNPSLYTYLRITDIYAEGRFTRQNISSVNHKDCELYLLADGDIVFADTAEDNIVGKAIEIVNVGLRKIVSGLHTIAFRHNKGLFAVPFLGYYINSVEYQRQIEPLIQGIKVCSISKTAIKETYLRIPSLAE